MSVKWKTMKVVFRYSESTSGPIIKPQWPLVFDLIDDPSRGVGSDREAPGLRLGDGPVRAPSGRAPAERRRYPNIKPGQEFTGYK